MFQFFSADRYKEFASCFCYKMSVIRENMDHFLRFMLPADKRAMFIFQQIISKSLEIFMLSLGTLSTNF